MEDPTEEIPEEPAGPRKTALIVDDQLLIRRLVGGMCQKAGFRTIDAEDGEQAVRLAKEWHPDIIFLDVMMPNKNGIEALHELRQDPDFEWTPVVMLTGDGNEDTVRQAAVEGITDFILKDNAGTIGPRVTKILEDL